MKSDLTTSHILIFFVYVFRLNMAMQPTIVNQSHLLRPDANVSASGFPRPWREPTFTTAAKVRVGITCCFFLIALCSNVTVLCSISGKRCKSHLRILILSLSIADLLVTLLVMPLDAMWNIMIQWYADELSCKILNFGKLFAMYSAALVLVVISLDRHWAILYPLSFTSAGQRNRIMLWTAWIGSLLLASPQV